MWIDLDASKEWGFGVIVFHVKENDIKNDASSKTKWPPRTAIEPIMYLSKLLTSADKKYWSTGLEIAGFVWVIKKVRHLVESCKYPVVIQTDHSAIVDIMRQKSIVSTSSTIRQEV